MECDRFLISINALAWSATKDGSGSSSTKNISINALAWSATFQGLPNAYRFSFQSTHSHGVRLYILDKITQYPDFNQRTRMECDGHHQAVSRSYGLVLYVFITKIWGFGYFFGSRVLVFLCVTKPRLNEKGSFIRVVGIIVTNGFDTALPIFSKSIKANVI